MTTESGNNAEVVLHIGTMKSGTSYIQAILRQNKRLLGRDGVLVPRSLVPAAVDALGHRGAGKEREVEGAWARFLNLVETWQGTSIIASQEFFSGATAAEAQGVLDTLPPGRTKIVITNRDLLRVVPSHWQTVIKNGGTWPFPEYVRLLLEGPGQDSGSEHRYSRGFWKHHDLAQIIDNWAGAVGIDNIVLVTVPPSGASSDELWKRFSKAVGVDASRYDAEPSAKSNVSLTYAETEMLREVNMQVRKPLNPLEYRLLVNKYLANRLLRKPPDAAAEPDRPRLGAASHELVRQRANEMVDRVAASGVQVVGDIDDLRVPAYKGDSDAVDSTGPQNPIPDSVPQAIAKLVLRIARLERDLERSRKISGDTGESDDLGDGSDLDDAVASMSAESPSRGGGRRGGGGGHGGGGGGHGGGGAGGGGGGAGGGGGGGKGAGKRGGGKKAAARKAARKAAAASSAADVVDDDDDDDDFDAFAAVALDLDDELGDI